MEDISTIFKEALKASVNKGPWGIKSQLSKMVGITPQQLHDIIIGRRYGTEEQRRAIASALGYEYDSFLDIGRKILNLPTRAEASPPPAPEYQRVINAVLTLDQTQLAALEAMLAAFGKLQQSGAGAYLKPGRVDADKGQGAAIIGDTHVAKVEVESDGNIKDTIVSGNKSTGVNGGN